MGNISDITQPDAVKQAIAEYDRIGKDAFLTKYGYRSAAKYFVKHEGKLFDSKAVLGVAYGFQFPKDGPLASNDFNGGEATVARVLKSLGFEVLKQDDDLLHPKRLWSRQELLSRPNPLPKLPGVYAWYFRNVPPIIPTTGCNRIDEYYLLYVGISPSAPPRNGKAPSTQSLLHRVRYHMQGNAEGSTLRLTLGCLLADQLGIELRRVGSGNRLTFSAGEKRLSEWMDENARVAWFVCDEPWKLEEKLISTLNLPLNLHQNSANAFFKVLSEVRRAAKIRAKGLEILPR
jgi:hypothetical protein